MANEQVSFEITANTKPASKAILDLKKELKNVGTIKSVDKNVVAQQKDLKKVLEGVNAAYEKQKSAYNQYDLNAKKIEKQSAALAEEEAFTKKLTKQYEELVAQKEKGTITPEGVNTMSRLEETIPHRLAKEEKSRASIAKLSEKNAQLDAYSEQVLQHILGSEKEIVRDEQTALGYKIQQRQATQDTVSAENEFERATDKVNSDLDKQAETTKKISDAFEDVKNKQNTQQEPPIDATETENTKDKLEELRDTVIMLKADIMQVNDAIAADPANDNLLELIRRYRTLSNAKKQMESVGMQTKDLDGTYATTVRLLAQLTNQIKAYKNGLSGIQKTNEKSKKSTEGFSDAIKGLKANLKAIKSGFNSLKHSSNGVKSSFDKMANSVRSNFKHMITSLTKYVLGFRSLFFLIRRLRKYIGEGIQNMAQFNDGNNHVNEGITRLLSSLLFLKNAWATAFSPIIQFVTPILENLIDTLAEVGNAFSRFLGGLLGQTTVFQAVKVDAQDYADSLDNAAGSAGSAADKTKKLTDRLAAFDDLNVLGVDNDPDGTGSGGGGGGADAYLPDPNEMFKLVEVDNKHFIEQLKSMWEKADFSELGSAIKEKIMGALESIKWEDVYATVRQVMGSLGTFIVGLFGDPKFWEDLGEFGAGLFNAITYGLQTFLDETKDTDFGGMIAQGINKFLTDMDWEQAGLNVNNLGNQILDNLIRFFETVDDGKLATALTDFLRRVDIPELAAKVGRLTLTASSAVLTIIGGLVFETGKSFGDWLYDWVSSENTSVVRTADGVEVPYAIKLNASVDANEHPIIALIMKLLGGPIEQTIKVGIQIGAWIGGEQVSEDVLKDFLSGNFFSSGYSDHSGETNAKDMERYTKVWDNNEKTKGSFSSLKTSIAESLGGIATDADTNSTTISSIISTLTSNVSTSFSDMKTNATTSWDTMKTNILNAVETAKTNVTTTLETWRTNLETTWFNIRTTAVSNFWTMKSKIEEAFEALRDGAKNIINNGILPVVEDMINFLIDGLNSFIDRLNSIPDVTFRSPFTGEDITLGVDLSRIGYVSIPRLAQGAVIPPNREFMAVLGDQSSGTNIEAPLDTIKQAVAEVLANNGNAEMIQLLQQLIAVVESKNLSIGDKEIGQANARYTQRQNRVRGVGF